MSATAMHREMAEPTPADAGIMAVPADPKGELAHYAMVAAARRAEERRRTTREWLLGAAAVTALAGAIAGWYSWARHPLIQQTVEFIPIAEDGTIASAFRWEALDPRVRGDAAINTVIQYVWNRESYSATGMDLAYRQVTALNDEITNVEYKAEVDPRNPNSPWAVYGEKVKVQVNYDSHWDLCPHTGCTDEASGYAVRFRRTEIREGVAGPSLMYVAQVRFKRNVPGIDPRQRAVFNAPALQVTQYVRGTPAGINSGAIR